MKEDELTATGLPPEAPHDGPSEEFVTIVGTTVAAVMAEFKAAGLAAHGYAIEGPIGHHQFRIAEGSEPAAIAGSGPLLAATFRRALRP